MSENQTRNWKDEPDLETVKEGFNQWIEKFHDQILEIEFHDPDDRGRVQKIEDDDSLKFRFVTEFNFSIMKLKRENSEEEKLKKEKEYNKKYGVEIKETFPFPIYEEDESIKGNK